MERLARTVERATTAPATRPCAVPNDGICRPVFLTANIVLLLLTALTFLRGHKTVEDHFILLVSLPSIAIIVNPRPLPPFNAQADSMGDTNYHQPTPTPTPHLCVRLTRKRCPGASSATNNHL